MNPAIGIALLLAGMGRGRAGILDTWLPSLQGNSLFLTASEVQVTKVSYSAWLIFSFSP
jgi:hypothetical protein